LLAGFKVRLGFNNFYHVEPFFIASENLPLTADNCN